MEDEVYYQTTKNGVAIKVILGDITKLNADAIVNAANSLMYMGGGVAGAIKRAGGQIIEDEARKYAPVEVGKAVITTAGKLPAKHVIHAPTMAEPAMRIPPENIRKAMNAILDVLKKEKIHSVAIPALGTGVGGVDRKTAADIMVSELLKRITDLKNLREVILIDINKDQAEYFKKVLEES